MGDFSLIQHLKRQTNCSTQEAFSLLKQCNNEVEKAIMYYHERNIQSIMQKTACDEQLANKYYQFFQQNKEKTIEKIQELQNHEVFIHKIITTREDKRSYHEPGFEIYIKSESEKYWYDNVEDYIFIPMKDVWLIEPIFSKYCDDFDYTFYNRFNHQAILGVIDELSSIENKEQQEMQFYQEVIEWLKQKSTPDNIIEIYGNI